MHDGIADTVEKTGQWHTSHPFSPQGRHLEV